MRDQGRLGLDLHQLQSEAEGSPIHRCRCGPSTPRGGVVVARWWRGVACVPPELSVSHRELGSGSRYGCLRLAGDASSLARSSSATVRQHTTTTTRARRAPPPPPPQHSQRILEGRDLALAHVLAALEVHRAHLGAELRPCSRRRTHRRTRRPTTAHIAAAGHGGSQLRETPTRREGSRKDPGGRERRRGCKQQVTGGCARIPN
jgi:hypothetical protein